MKLALVMMVGFSIGTLITISAIQLLKVIFQGMVNMTIQAWHSPEHN